MAKRIYYFVIVSDPTSFPDLGEMHGPIRGRVKRYRYRGLDGARQAKNAFSSHGKSAVITRRGKVVG